MSSSLLTWHACSGTVFVHSIFSHGQSKNIVDSFKLQKTIVVINEQAAAYFDRVAVFGVSSQSIMIYAPQYRQKLTKLTSAPPIRLPSCSKSSAVTSPLVISTSCPSTHWIKQNIIEDLSQNPALKSATTHSKRNKSCVYQRRTRTYILSRSFDVIFTSGWRTQAAFPIGVSGSVAWTHWCCFSVTTLKRRML